jgi:FixJ family two-component response regulator
LSQLPNEDQAGCILLDVRLPDLSGPELQIRLNELGFALPVIFLTGYPDINDVVRAIKAGAEDVLIKPIESDELLRATERAVARHEKSRASKMAIDGHRIRFASLTPREQQVFRLVVRGNVNKQIARQIGAAVRTVKAHRERVMEKMGVKSLAELVSVAARVGELNE